METSVSPIESMHARIERMAVDQGEVVDRIREMHAAINEALVLLKSRDNQSMREVESSESTEETAMNDALTKVLPRKAPMLRRSELVASVHCAALPAGWPVSVQLRKGLRSASTVNGKSDLAMSEKLSCHRRTRHSGRASSFFTSQEQHDCWWWWITKMIGPWNPHSKENVMFDCIGLVILLYDLCSTPIQLAWNVPIEGSLLVFGFTSVIYWTVCIPVTFRTGFYECGELKMDPKEIAWNYFRKAFCFDVLLVLIDWIAITTTDPSGTLMALRVCRLFKVIRVLKIMAIFDKIVSHRLGNNSKGLVLMKVGGFTLVFAHMMCCAWYAIGHLNMTDTQMHWVDGYTHDDLFYMYLTAYHWVLNQITLGSSDVPLTNSYERLFGITLNVFGLLYSSTIVSIVSAQAMEYVTVRRERIEDMSRLSGFLEQHKVEHRFANRIRRQANDRLKATNDMPTEDRVKALNLLSKDIRMELLLEVRWPHVVTHPLFQYWARTDQVGAVRRLCDEAVSFMALMPQDCAFMPGVAAQHAYFVTPLRKGLSKLVHATGPMSYTQSSDTAFVDEEETVFVKECSWIAEAALWTDWTHVGKLTAHYTCQLLTIEASKLQDTLSAFSRIADLTRVYAREFCLRLRAAAPPFSPWPTDLHVPDADPENLLSEHAYRGLLMREWKAGRLNINETMYEELLDEVTSEKSAMVSVPGQGLQRVVFVCTLQLQRYDGHIFVQVGKWSEAKGMEPVNAVLPGTKRDRSELPHKALERLLTTELVSFEGGIELSHATEEAEYKESPKYGMMTKYLRTVNVAELREDFEMPPLPVATLRTEETSAGTFSDITNLPIYCNTEVFVIHDRDDRAGLYAWLSEDEIDLVRGPEQHVLKSWIMSLDPSRLLLDPSRLENRIRVRM